MKKSILTFLIMLLALSGTMAQQTEVNKLSYSVSSDVPMVVLAAVESDYPGMNIREHLPSPALTSKKDLRKQIKTPNPPDYYAVITGRDYRKTANYNKEGQLIDATEKIRNIAVPRPVLNTIGREYNGWLVTKNLATRFISSTYNNVFYEVWLKNGRKKQKLTMDASGKILLKKRPGI